MQYENTDGGDLMMLPTDIALIEDPAFKKWVDVYAKVLLSTLKPSNRGEYV
jgi:catalase (peroxidase I)